MRALFKIILILLVGVCTILACSYGESRDFEQLRHHATLSPVWKPFGIEADRRYPISPATRLPIFAHNPS